MRKLTRTEVFTPSDFPKFTYVSRNEIQLDRRLREALETPGEVVSVSGPSKSGKTVLVEKVVGHDNLITITGAGIRTPDQLWDRVLDWMDTPTTTTGSKSLTGSAKVTAGAHGEAHVPFVAKGGVSIGAEVGGAGTTTDTSTTGRRGMAQVVEEIANSAFVLLVDDFHYMDRAIQVEVARQLKEAARLHVKICTASVPHRSDDVVRSNPELRGRVRTIDLKYWNPDELWQIALIGSQLLNFDIEKDSLLKFGQEAAGSPQLMQAICLQTCFQFEVRETLDERTKFLLGAEKVKKILEETATRTDYSSLIRNMHTGPKTRGAERKEFDFSDGTRGDVYRCVLLSLASDPPRLSMPYNELSRRIQRICTGETPQAASVYQASEQIAKIALEMYPNERVIEWEDDNLLDIIDPYLLFFLRWSGKLANLARLPDNR